ncbi:MAG TPA: serine protease [Vicinamibacterales bacterium]|nr:serine protease [Vicinamibacterales bacterium]
MSRVLLIVATLFAVMSRPVAGQEPSVLHITVVLTDAAGKPMPVPRHALLISDNPATSSPRRVTTKGDGTADVRLRPGNYTVESDMPVAFNGKAYGWTQIIDISAGRDAVLRLTTDNAEITMAAPGTPAVAPAEVDASMVVAPWQASVVTLWTPTARASGFVIGADGLIATSARVVGTARSLDVQVTPTIKVAGAVVVADSARAVAVLRIDPAAVASMPPVPFACAPAQQPTVVSGQKLFTIDAPLFQPRSTASATAARVAAHDVDSDFSLSPGSVGGPVFAADGLVGLTVADVAESTRVSFRVIRLDDLCAVAAAAREKIKATPAPNGTHLPVEPARTIPDEVLKDAVQRRVGTLNPYQAASASFDVFFLTPLQTRDARGDFGNWSEYVAGTPPVLLVRVTPKMVEGFWTKVARGAAMTQGLAIPAIKRFTSGFSRLRGYCGDVEVTPIHPFTIERPVSDTEAIDEGLYVFDPGALGPSCSSVKLMLYSLKEPAKADTLTVDPKVIQRIWDDFAPYRALK